LWRLQVRSIIEDVGFIEVGCEMCAEKYKFDDQEVLAMVEAMKAPAA
jgi:redox-regulated HSP33 family molecular chaperone